MEEGKNHDGVVVFFRDGHQVEVVMFVEVEQVVLLVFDYWLERVFVVLQDFFVECVVDITGEIGAEVSRDEHSALLVENVDCGDATHLNCLNFKI
jgi:hypothetical protein